MKKLLLNALFVWIAISAVIVGIVQLKLTGRLVRSSPLIDRIMQHPSVRVYAEIWRQVDDMLSRVSAV